MITLRAHVTAQLQKTIHDLWQIPSTPSIRQNKNQKEADYQTDLSFLLAKTLSLSPLEVAQKICEHLHSTEAGAFFEKLYVSGPGFINICIKQEKVTHFLLTLLGEERDQKRLGIPLLEETPATDSTRADSSRIVIDYCGANVAKEMHVGHLRSTIIGDCLARVLTFLGYDVCRQNHVGDWGTQFGHLIQYLLEDPSLRASLKTIGDLNTAYRHSKVWFDEDKKFETRARQRVYLLQSGDEESQKLWQELVAITLTHFNEVFAKLTVLLTDDDVRGESAYNPILKDVVAAFEEKGLLHTVDGARALFLEGFVDREKNPLPFVIQKSDGAYLYSTTDLAAVFYRLHTLKASRLIYVTDARQKQHFQMIFAAAEKIGWKAPHHSLEHVAFGAILGEDRKPFKTRSGDTISLVSLLDEAERRAQALLEEKGTPQGATNGPTLPLELANAIGIGALKYADLSNDLTKDYVFNWDNMLSFTGNTAPYLQNAYVRIQSIFRRGEITEVHLAALSLHPSHLTSEKEHVLGLKILEFGEVVHSVADRLQPHLLCTYLYDLACLFHDFYESCPVLKEADLKIRENRLSLCFLTAQTLKMGLSLLGIKTVDVM